MPPGWDVAFQILIDTVVTLISSYYKSFVRDDRAEILPLPLTARKYISPVGQEERKRERKREFFFFNRVKQ